jgi:hypothetical protein
MRDAGGEEERGQGSGFRVQEDGGGRWDTGYEIRDTGWSKAKPVV